MFPMPRILVTNDDGVHSDGIRLLAETLAPFGDITVVAPIQEASAIGHALTLRRPLRIDTIGPTVFAIDGTPTDCVNIAVTHILKGKPDLIVSGINKGWNLGDDITYSGTVSAAMESVINGCPAFAISQEYYEHPDFTLAGLIAYRAAVNILENGLAPGELININVPGITVEECQGVEVTRLGKRIYQDELLKRLDPRGTPYYWLGGPPPTGLAEPGTDFDAVVNKRVAITPIQLDLTARRLLKRLNSWSWEIASTAPPADDARHNRG